MDQIRPQNVFGAAQQGWAYGSQLKQQRQQEQNQNALRQLAPGVINGDPAALSQAAAIDPAAASKYDAVGVDIAKRGAGAASYMLDAVKRGNPQEIQGRWNNVIPYLTKLAAANGAPPPPASFDPAMTPLMEQLVARSQGMGATDPSNKVFAQKIDADGNIWNTMADGSMVNTGVKADRQMWFRDQPGVDPGLVDKSGTVTPLTNTGQPSPAPPVAPARSTTSAEDNQFAAGMNGIVAALQQRGFTPEQIEQALPAFEAATNGATGAQQFVQPDQGQSSAPPPPTQAPSTGPATPMPATGPAATRPLPTRAPPAGYRDDGQGGLAPIPGGPAQVAIDARSDAAAARKTADELKVSAKRQEVEARQNASSEAANQLITSIDDLTKHPGFADLGTTWGDAKIATPLIRSDAKDANAKLKNVAGQVALATMARLKTLSQSGATGFGSLTAPELNLLQNSIATLQSENISNAELSSSLKVIRDAMEKTASWTPPADGAPSQSGDDIDSLLDIYR